MKVFIVNLGEGNYLWPECQRRSTVATLDSEGVHGFWVRGDRQGYIDYSVANLKTAQGETPIRSVASKWYGITDAIATTSGDIWIHRQKDELWWTTSKGDPMEKELKPSLTPWRDGKNVFELHKPCEPWSNRTRAGARLPPWSGVHPYAQRFLFTEGTLQALSPDNAAYALAMINGDELTAWEDRREWRTRAAKSGRGSVKVLNPRQDAIRYMVDRVLETVAYANGQELVTIVKAKECLFTEDALAVEIDQLLVKQKNRCALTGLPLQFPGTSTDEAMLCSLDRIDSEKHYEPGNLQVVCRFVNFWKGASGDNEFRRLLGVVRGMAVGP